MARRSAATIGRLAGVTEAETGVDAVAVAGGCSAGGGVVIGCAGAVIELRGWTGSLPCILADGDIDEADGVAVAVMEPDASSVTETLPDAVLMVAFASPSLLMVAVAVAGGVVAAPEAAAEVALLTP